jgi:hypothetical protein
MSWGRNQKIAFADCLAQNTYKLAKGHNPDMAPEL